MEKNLWLEGQHTSTCRSSVCLLFEADPSLLLQQSALNNPSTSKGGRQHARNQLIIVSNSAALRKEC